MKLTLTYLIPAAAAALLLLGPGRASAADTGAELYQQKCAMCHGADGSGQTGMGRMYKLRDLKSAEVQAMTDAQLYTLIADGKGKMPAFGASLGKTKIDEVIAHLRAMAKPKK
jgi:mono/diheme cytochrome c family protein